MTLVSGPTPANLRTFSVLYVLGNVIVIYLILFFFRTWHLSIPLSFCVFEYISLLRSVPLDFYWDRRVNVRRCGIKQENILLHFTWSCWSLYFLWLWRYVGNRFIFLIYTYVCVFCVIYYHGIQKVNIGVVLVLLLIQIMAGIWYSASYIPFGRKIIITVLRNSICKPCFEAYDSMKGSGGGNGGGNGGFSRLSTQA